MNSRTLLFAILVVLLLAFGFWMWSSGTGTSNSYTANTTTINGTSATTTQNATGTVSGNTTGGVVVSPSRLTDGQKKMLSVMGIDPNNIVLTPKMIACADASLGSARIKELEGGATPSFTEGIKLAACYK